MPIVMPPTSTALGRRSVVFLDPADVTSPDMIPTVAEINTSGVFASLHIYGDFNITPTQNTGEGPRPIGSKNTPTELGLVNYPATTVQYSIKPQDIGTPGAPGNEVYETLVPDSQKIGVVLEDVSGDIAAVTAGMIADIFLFNCGVRAKGATGTGEFDVQAATSQLVVAGGAPIAEDHKLAAS